MLNCAHTKCMEIELHQSHGYHMTATAHCCFVCQSSTPLGCHMTCMWPSRDHSHADAYWSSNRCTSVVVLLWSSKAPVRRRGRSSRRPSPQRRGGPLTKCNRHWPGAVVCSVRLYCSSVVIGWCTVVDGAVVNGV